MRKNYQTERIKLLIMDVDGVLTDGSVYMNEEGKEYLRFSRIDGKGIELLKWNEVKIGVISEEKSLAAQWRLKKLKIDLVALGIKDKLKIYEKWKRKLGLKDKNICFCGDDIQDLDLMKKSGYSCCPKNAQEIIKRESDFVSKRKGGEGFVREICNLILEAQDKK